MILSLSLHRLRPLVFAGPLAAALIGSVSAQANAPGATVRRGLASTWAAGLSLNSTNPGNVGVTNATILKAPDAPQPPTQPWYPVPTANAPDYSIAALFGGLFSDIDVDAHSTGNGVLPRMNAQGQLEQDDNWLAVVVSATRGTHGGTGSQFERARIALGHPGSELISHYWDGSEGINSALVGSTMVEDSSPDLNFQSVGGTGTPDIDALDYGLGMITHTVPRNQALFFRNRDDYFFSVSKSWALNNQVAFARVDEWATNATESPDPRVIYRMEWNGAGWSLPAVYKTAADFELESGTDLDAFDIDLHHRTMIFSAAGNEAHLSQIMFMQETKGGDGNPQAESPTPLPSGEVGTTAQEKIDVGNLGHDDVDALCSIDPESGVSAMNVGIPVAHDPEMGTPMGLSIARARYVPNDSDAPSSDRLILGITGWGAGAAQDGFVAIELHGGPIAWDGSMPEGGWGLVEVVARSAADDSLIYQIPNINSQGTGGEAYLRATNYRFVPGIGWKTNGASWATEIRP